jgi:hypothetical protein
MSDTKRFTFHETPGHGYLEVPLEFLRELQISQLISGYSYMGEDAKGDTVVYCEEDCDMGVVCTRMELDGISFEIEDVYEDEEDGRWTDQFESYDGDFGDFGELEQRTEGLEEFLGLGEEEEDWDEEEEEDEDDEDD